jgi:ABC-type microcin C transport system permease subunit YejE
MQIKKLKIGKIIFYFAARAALAIYLFLLLFFSKVIKDKLAGKEKPLLVIASRGSHLPYVTYRYAVTSTTS